MPSQGQVAANLPHTLLEKYTSKFTSCLSIQWLTQHVYKLKLSFVWLEHLWLKVSDKIMNPLSAIIDMVGVVLLRSFWMKPDTQVSLGGEICQCTVGTTSDQGLAVICHL